MASGNIGNTLGASPIPAMSSAVKTPRTPGAVLASAVSMLTILAWASMDRTYVR